MIAKKTNRKVVLKVGHKSFVLRVSLEGKILSLSERSLFIDRNIDLARLSPATKGHIEQLIRNDTNKKQFAIDPDKTPDLNGGKKRK